MHHEKPAIVLADLMMPNKSGAELVSNMKLDPMLADVPVLIMSAWPTTASEVGAEELLSKPIDVEHLVRSIRRYCH